jgi:hypothetical protein
MQINEHNTIGQTNSSKLNPARQARQDTSAGTDSAFGKLVSEIAKQKQSPAPAASD